MFKIAAATVGSLGQAYPSATIGGSAKRDRSFAQRNIGHRTCAASLGAAGAGSGRRLCLGGELCELARLEFFRERLARRDIGVEIDDRLARLIVEAVEHGHIAAQAILAALLNRERFGHGDVVEVSLYDAACHLHAHDFTEFLMTGRVAKRTGNNMGLAAPSGVFETSDGAIVLATYLPHHWEITLDVAKDDISLGQIDVPGTVIAMHVGKVPPAWNVTDARGLSKTITLADLKGKWVVIEFWGFW